MVDVLLGLQWGDEGKGKVVDFLAAKYDVVARFQGGPNAGHTLYINGSKVVLRTIPSGVFNPKIENLIGNGVVIDPATLRDEIKNLENIGLDVTKHLFIAKKAHLILPTHRVLDAASESSKGNEKIGSTLKGIGPTYMDKTGRNGLRVGDVFTDNWTEKYQKLKQKHIAMLAHYDVDIDWSEWENEFLSAIDYLKTLNVVDGEYWINERIQAGKKILAEGAQGSMLDVDYGTYPFVTSSNTLSSGVCTGLGIAPKYIQDVYGITKAYCTRVGSGPFPTELEDEVGQKLRDQGNEYGAVTKRPRRCGWIDLVALKYTIMLSGVNKLIITKADVLDGFDEIKVATSYKINGVEYNHVPFDICNEKIEPVYTVFKGWSRPISECKNGEILPQEILDYCQFLEDYLQVKIEYISNGTGREQLLTF